MKDAKLNILSGQAWHTSKTGEHKQKY